MRASQIFTFAVFAIALIGFWPVPAFAQNWIFETEQNGVCIIANQNITIRLAGPQGPVEFAMSGMRRRDGGRDIFVDRVYVGRTKYEWDGLLTLTNRIPDGKIIELFVRGRTVGSAWKQVSLLGFTDAFSRCSFGNQITDQQQALSVAPSTPSRQPSPGSVLSDSVSSDPCLRGPIETQARCQCESQGFKRETQEFIICFQSVLDRVRRSEELQLEAERQQKELRQQQFLADQRAEEEQRERQRKALGGFLRGLGKALAETPAPIPRPAPQIIQPAPQRCVSRWVGGGLVTNCF